MKETVAALFREALERHRGCVLGAGAGALAGLAVLVFGFWNIMFIAVCAAAGLWLGKQAERGGWPERLRGMDVRDFFRRR